MLSESCYSGLKYVFDGLQKIYLIKNNQQSSEIVFGVTYSKRKCPNLKCPELMNFEEYFTDLLGRLGLAHFKSFCHRFSFC